MFIEILFLLEFTVNIFRRDAETEFVRNEQICWTVKSWETECLSKRHRQR